MTRSPPVGLGLRADYYMWNRDNTAMLGALRRTGTREIMNRTRSVAKGTVGTILGGNSENRPVGSCQKG